MNKDRIERSVLVNAPITRVWEIVPEARHLGSWFGDHADIELRPGGPLVLTWKEFGTFHCTVEHVEPPSLFVWSRPVHPDVAGSPGNSTRVEFHLTQEGDGTRLTVVETGFDRLAMRRAERDRHHAENVEGWRLKLDELRAYASAAHSR